MYQYIEANRGEEIGGSTTGVVVEWTAHNIACDVGIVASSVGFTEFGEYLINKGKVVDLDYTIYDDPHGIITLGMCGVYNIIFPITAKYDLVIMIFQE